MQRKNPATVTMETAGHALRAGGSLPETIAPPLSVVRRARLIAEIGLFFVAGPLVMAYLVRELRVPLLLMFLPVLAGLLAYLALDPTFRLRRELARGFRLRELLLIVALFVVVSSAVSIVMWLFRPSDFLSFPTHNPRLWALVMVFYPLLSALPQELAYRTLFFHRYGPLFGGRKLPAIAVDGALFGFAHVIFGSGVSVVLSGALGFVLAWRYTRTRALHAVWLEHALYGQLVFTVGLGRYFFTGVSLN